MKKLTLISNILVIVTHIVMVGIHLLRTPADIDSRLSVQPTHQDRNCQIQDGK